jgi:hypothetical protein
LTRDWRRREALLGSGPITERDDLQLVTILLLASAVAEPVKIEPSEFELKPRAPALRATPEPCRRTAATGDIVVCGRSEDLYRFREIRPPSGLDINSGGIIGLDLGGGARMGPTLEEVGMPDGRVSKRIMVTVKVPF